MNRKTVIWGGVAIALLLTITLVFVLVWAVDGASSGPESTQTTSIGIPTLEARVRFLERYVKFRRTYETLEFDIFYHDNSRGLPAPSDWDIRLVATVPATEIPAWIPAGASPSAVPDTEWLKTVPTSIDVSGVSEWYAVGRRVLGLDLAKRVVVCRLTSVGLTPAHTPDDPVTPNTSAAPRPPASAPP